ncbi:MAG: glucose-6-phosphate isomerase [bacterium]
MREPRRREIEEALRGRAEAIGEIPLHQLFEREPRRFDRMSIRWQGLLVDYSKNRIDEQAFELLLNLARAAEVEAWRERMFLGEVVNTSERRPALHVALRNRSDDPVRVGGRDVMPDVRAVLDRMRELSESVRNGDWKGFTGEPIRDVVNLGIGGSDLGPRMVTTALDTFRGDGPRVHFVSNVDGRALARVLEEVDPERTLFIVCSKSFGTQETLTNARTARRWLVEALGDERAVARHFVAVSTSRERVEDFGIDPEQMFEFWDWVGGRYSLWSAIGLSIAISIGMEGFDALLEGAHAMDVHFRDAPLDRNIPVVLALLGIWYADHLGAETHAVFPYSEDLRLLPAHLQQLDMESNGKSVRRDGRPVEGTTAPIVWGAPGTDGQHAFFQLLHQGTRLVPTDFLVPIEPPPGSPPEHHRILVAHALAQTEALARGRDAEETRERLEAEGLDAEAVEREVPHRVVAGNRPSNTILFDRLDPWHVGALVALYEHRVFVQGVVWEIDSFDQWGVELGKTLAESILGELSGKPRRHAHDPSTEGLLEAIRRHPLE